MPRPRVWSPRASAYTRTRATALMQYRCKAERVSTGSHDEDLVYRAGARTQLFDEEQPCRVWEISGATAVTLGETEIMTQNLQISLPWDSPTLKKNDEIYLTGAPEAEQYMIGKRFEVTTQARAGEMRATRRYTVRAVDK